MVSAALSQSLCAVRQGRPFHKPPGRSRGFVAVEGEVFVGFPPGVQTRVTLTGVARTSVRGVVRGTGTCRCFYRQRVAPGSGFVRARGGDWGMRRGMLGIERESRVRFVGTRLVRLVARALARDVVHASRDARRAVSAWGRNRIVSDSRLGRNRPDCKSSPLFACV